MTLFYLIRNLNVMRSKNFIIMLLGVAVLLGCSNTPKPQVDVSINDKKEVLTSLMNHNSYGYDLNSSTMDTSGNIDGDKVMFSILKKLRMGHDRVTSKKEFILLKKKNKSKARVSLQNRMKSNPVAIAVSKVLRPLKPRYCTKVIFLKTLRRKILAECIMTTRKLGFYQRARIRIQSMNKLLLDPKNVLCVNSKVMVYMNKKIIKEKKCLDEIDSVYQVVSPIGIIQK